MSIINDMLSKRRNKTFKEIMSKTRKHWTKAIAPTQNMLVHRLTNSQWPHDAQPFTWYPQQNNPVNPKHRTNLPPAQLITWHACIKWSQPRYSGPQLAFAHVYATCIIKCDTPKPHYLLCRMVCIYYILARASMNTFSPSMVCWACVLFHSCLAHASHLHRCMHIFRPGSYPGFLMKGFPPIWLKITQDPPGKNIELHHLLLQWFTNGER